MKAYLEDREVEIHQIEHGADYCDSYIIAASFVDSGEDLSEDELNELTELCVDMLYEEWQERRMTSSYDRLEEFYENGD
jgi:hypothetical protein